MASVDRPLWTPDPARVASAAITHFRDRLAAALGRPLPTYAALHRASVEEPAAFWPALWRFAGVRGEMGERVVDRPGAMPGTRFFPDARLNFAENVLRRGDDDVAIIAETEAGATRTLSWAELRRDVARVAQALRRSRRGAGRPGRRHRRPATCPRR